MTIDLVDNPEHFEDVYPSDSEDAASFKNNISPEPDEESEAVRDVNSQLRRLNWSIKEAAEQRNSGQGRLNMLENYARSMTTTPNDIEASVGAYQLLRAKAFESHRDGEIKLGEHEEEIKKLKVKKSRLLQVEKEKKSKAEESKARAKKIEEREKQRIRSEKDRLKRERIQFWPKKVYKVVICVDTKLDMTPGSSRRGSIDSLQKPLASSHASGKGNSDSRTADVSTIDLSFSYITNSASWSPRYELAMNTTSKTGSITYRAEFRNTTSETWHDAKVVLSTSQTSFQGLGEAIPQIQPWHIRLAKGYGENATDEALFSRGEQDSRYMNRGLFGQKPRSAHSQLFGKSTGSNSSLPAPFGASVQPAGGIFGASSNAASGGSLFGASSNAASGRNLFSASSNAASGGGLFSASSNAFSGGGLFGSSTNGQQASVFGAASPASTATSGFGALQAQPNVVRPLRQAAPAIPADEDEVDIDSDTITPDLAALEFEESTW